MSKEFDQQLDDFFKNYQDRGMKKWQGFFLSDHTATMNRDNYQRSTVYSKKEAMTEAVISGMLLKAYANHLPVTVQLKEVDLEGNLQPNIVGFVQGYDMDGIIISGEVLKLDNINHVDFQ
ncbi:hypothetical protein [Lactobacillus xylocopicola]|uniref:DNA-directed RNA polymerase beta subunit n=1 Tax=Lactobacillus xylocopicola TaxID=2976676 RepID=A0ABN6SNJ0_9LACO|nr:hypothetical protein [Lactobacillus xylocopicola]BDR60786.1 hypothetical protein KIM322_10470 [Lactobacillus xylocopicola]